MLHKSQVQHTRPGHYASTPTEAAPGAVGVGEHDEDVADREVDLIARKYEKNSTASKKTEERSQHTFSSIVLTVCVITRVLPEYYQGITRVSSGYCQRTTRGHTC